MIERLPRQARRLGRLLDRRAPKTMAAEHQHRCIENAGTGLHLTILTKEDEVSNHDAVLVPARVSPAVSPRVVQVGTLMGENPLGIAIVRRVLR